MLYLGNNLVYSIGSSTVADAPGRTENHGSVYVEQSCLIPYNYAIQNTTRNYFMQRTFDLLNYSGTKSLGGEPDVGGFEMEATFRSVKDTGWGTLWGARVATSGRVTRVNLLTGNSFQVSQGISFSPSTNPAYGDSILGRKINVRFICIPTVSETYAHAYSGRVIVKDADTNELLTDETDIFGDNFSSNALFSTYTTFWKEPLSWFYRASSYTPANIGYGTADFKGYFFGGAIYVNPLGIDQNIPARIPIHVLTPLKAGTTFVGSGVFNTSDGITRVYSGDCIIDEIINMYDFDRGSYNYRQFVVNMQNASQFQQHSIIKYID